MRERICTITAFLCTLTLQALSQDNTITGTITDHHGRPVADVNVSLHSNTRYTTTSGADGTYRLTDLLPVREGRLRPRGDSRVTVQGRHLFLHLPAPAQRVTVSLFSPNGAQVVIRDRAMAAGSSVIDLADPSESSSLRLLSVRIDNSEFVLKTVSLRGNRSAGHTIGTPPPNGTAAGSLAAARRTAAIDTLLVRKEGFESRSRALERLSGTHDFTMVPAALQAAVRTIHLAQKTTLSASHTAVDRYGIKPQVATCANADNSLDVALFISTANRIQIFSFNAAGTKTADFTPAFISGAKALVGLTKVTDDNSYVVAFSKDNVHGDVAFEYWISRISSSGDEIFSKRIFGDQKSTVVESEGQPGSAGSGRLAYNPLTRKIGFYCSHSRLWNDNVRHQGGHIGFMDLDGAFITANSWFFSHNFDQRLVVVDSFYYALAHGDAYPRALGFSKWKDTAPSGKKLVDAQYFTIPGSIGDNTTNTQTGGLLPLPDGTFGVVFSTSIGRSGYDIRYKRLSAAGATLDSTWLTSYPSTTFAIFPRIAAYGTGVLIAWEEVTARTPVVQTRIIEPDGTTLSSQRRLEGAVLSPFYDLVSTPDGVIHWATLKASDSLALWRIAP